MSERSPQDRSSNQAIGLKEYLDAIGRRIREQPPAWVRCELLTITPREKFVRMELIEHGGDRQVAKAQGGCWPDQFERIAAAFGAAGLTLEAGTKVLVQLKAQFNPNYGFSVEAVDIDPSFTLGDLRTRSEAIRRKLREAGIWDANRSRPRPRDYVRLAVIAPSGAAGLGDFRTTADVLAVRGLVEFTYFEAPFQSAMAPARIVDILRAIYSDCRAARYCAVAIVRGGGASADLAWLVDETLTRAVCHMPVPVITGIGHERDRNLIDEVACLPCDTPSKAVELIRTTVVNAAVAADRAIQDARSQARSDLARLCRDVLHAESNVRAGGHELVRRSESQVSAAIRGSQPDARRSLDRSRDLVTVSLEDSRAQGRARHEAAGRIVAVAYRATNQNALQSIGDAGKIVQAIAAVVANAPDVAISKADAAIDAAHRSTTTHAETSLRTAEHVLAAAATARAEIPLYVFNPAKSEVARAHSDIASTASTALATVNGYLQRICGAVADHARDVPDDAARHVKATHQAALDAAVTALDGCETRVARIQIQADALHPRRVVAAGYAIIRAFDGRPVTNVGTLRQQDVVIAEMRDGAATLQTIAEDQRA